VVFGFEVQGYPASSTGFPVADDQMTRTIERPVIVAGRLFDPRRTDEARPLGDDYAEAGDYYRRQAKDAMETVRDVLARARDAFNERRARRE